MSEMNPQSAEPDQNPTRYRNKIQNLRFLHPPPCPAGAAQRVGGPPNARKLPIITLTKSSKKCHEALHLPQPDSPEEQDRRKETAYIRLYGELAVD